MSEEYRKISELTDEELKENEAYRALMNEFESFGMKNPGFLNNDDTNKEADLITDESLSDVSGGMTDENDYMIIKP